MESDSLIGTLSFSGALDTAKAYRVQVHQILAPNKGGKMRAINLAWNFRILFSRIGRDALKILDVLLIRAFMTFSRLFSNHVLNGFFVGDMVSAPFTGALLVVIDALQESPVDPRSC